MFSDDDLAQPLVGEAMGMEKIVVEEMAKRPVPDVVDQGRDTEELFDEIGRGHILHDFLEKRVQVSSKPSRDVHRPERMHKPGMFRGRIDPASTLQLVDVSQPLNPGGVDQVFLGVLMRIRMSIGDGEGDVLVDGISDERRAIIGSVRSVC